MSNLYVTIVKYINEGLSVDQHEKSLGCIEKIVFSIKNSLDNPTLSDFALFVNDVEHIFPVTQSKLNLDDNKNSDTFSPGNLSLLLKKVSIERSVIFAEKLSENILDLYSALSRGEKNIQQEKQNLRDLLENLEKTIKTQ